MKYTNNAMEVSTQKHGPAISKNKKNEEYLRKTFN